MSTFKIRRLPEQTIDSREHLGCDFGSESRVLAISGLARLVWSKPTRTAVGMRGMGSTTQASTLEMRVYRRTSDGSMERYYGTDLAVGGRISRSRLAHHRVAIDQCMGTGATDALDPKWTMVFGPDLVGELMATLRARPIRVPPAVLEFIERARTARPTRADFAGGR